MVSGRTDDAYADREMAYEHMSRSFPPPLRLLVNGPDRLATEPADDARQALEACAAYLDESGGLAAHPTVPLALAVLAAERGDVVGVWYLLVETPGVSRLGPARLVANRRH